MKRDHIWTICHLPRTVLDILYTASHLSNTEGFPCDSAGKESVCNAGDLSSVPGLGRSPGEVKDYPFQYSGLENSMDCIVHEVAKNQTERLSLSLSSNT